MVKTVNLRVALCYFFLFLGREESTKDRGVVETIAVEARGKATLEAVEFTVEARADRIDQRCDGGEYVVVDYKTGDPPKRPQMLAGFSHCRALSWPIFKISTSPLRAVSALPTTII